MRILGINCMNHDAAMAIVEFDKKGPGKVVWAAHAERYSKIKNDHYLNHDIVNEAKSLGWNKVVYYEKPILKKTRQVYSGQYRIALDN
jgi:carbamoyltransferase